MQLLADYEAAKQKVFEYFGYVEDWRIIPLDDDTESFWRVEQSADGSGIVFSADTEDELRNEDGNYYENEIYTQRFLPKWVYRGPDYTMICIDTCTDGNKFLRVFSNALERP